MQTTALHYITKPRDYTIRGRAYLPAEGIGVHGVFSIKGYVALRGQQVDVSARGFTPAMLAPGNAKNISWYSRAALIHQGREVTGRELDMAGVELWPDDEFVPIGCASIPIPGWLQGTLFRVRVTGGYVFRTGNGSVVPVPPTASAEISVEKTIS